MVTKLCFFGDDFMRKPLKYKRFYRPICLCFKEDYVTHPELKVTFCLLILGMKKNISSPLYTILGAITKSRVIDVVMNEFGLVTQKARSVRESMPSLPVSLKMMDAKVRY